MTLQQLDSLGLIRQYILRFEDCFYCYDTLCKVEKHIAELLLDGKFCMLEVIDLNNQSYFRDIKLT